MSKNPAQQLIEFGQSVWYDNISRDLLDSGEIKSMIDNWGVRGITSNPSIFDNAIRNSEIYDQQISSLKSSEMSADQVFEELAIEDIGRAADLFRQLYDQSGGTDGYVSIEVSPLLARDTEGTIKEARRLFERLARPNIMIKIPGTQEGLPAVRQCLEDGINVNVTLLFSVSNYAQVAETYIDALNARLEKGLKVDNIASVASFFVSRVDSVIDAELEKRQNAQSLMGQYGVANSKLAYEKFLELFEGEKFSKAKAAGAKVQRPLWASTSTKNPDYRDVLYIEELIGPDTVNTIPHKTLEAFVDHGRAKDSLTSGIEKAKELDAQLRELGIDIDSCLDQLQVAGVDAFAKAFDNLNAGIQKKLS